MKRSVVAVLMLLVLGWPVSWCAAQDVKADKKPTEKQAKEERVEIPPAPETYMERTIATTMHYLGAPWLVRGERFREEGTKMFLAQLKIEEGTTLCDMGCGNGFYTIPMAKQTGEEGKVYAVDIQQEMLDLLETKAEEAEVSNIEPKLGNAIDPKLPDGEIDLMIVVDVYHEMSHPVHMLAAIRKAMKPEGRLVLLEFREEDPEVRIKPLHKMSKEQVIKELAANGFKLKASFDELPMQHMLTFVVDADWKGGDGGKGGGDEDGGEGGEGGGGE